MENIQQLIAPYIGYLGDNPLLQAIAIVVLSAVLAWLFDRIVMALISKIMAKASDLGAAELFDLVRRPVFYTLILIGLAIAISLISVSEGWKKVGFSLLVTLALVVWTAFILRFSKTLLRRLAASEDRYQWLHSQTLPLFENLAYLAIVAISVYYIFSAWHVDMTAWLASAGIVGIAVGFAAKDTLANLFSGVFILADAPYKIGDFVVLDGVERGEITKIGLRSTRMITRDDVEVTVPNSVMGNTKIINESGGPHEKYRIRVNIGAAYGADIDQVREILLALGNAEEAVCSDPEPRVRLRRFGPSSLDFELLCWVDQPVLQGRILDRLHCAVYKKFMEEGVEIPYSKQDIYIKELPKSEE